MPSIVCSTVGAAFEATTAPPTAGNSATENAIRKAIMILTVRIRTAVTLTRQQASNKKFEN